MSDGSWESHGNLPLGLESLMNDRQNEADLKWCSIGPNGQWCVKAKNNRVWWDALPKEADDSLTEFMAEDGQVELCFLDFGVDSTYFLLHK